MKRPILAAVLVVLWAVSALIGHGGGTDSYGCHRDTKAGDYHCHSGQFSGRSFGSQSAMLAARTEATKAATAGAAEAKVETIIVAPLNDGFLAPYSRALYGEWNDADGDCQTTRVEVLLEEALEKPIINSAGCGILAGGKWYDPYTGKMVRVVQDMDVDHFIPLAEVHRSGGDVWGPERRRLYANDLSDARTLIAVSAAANRSKGDKDPSEWLPSNPDFQCVYVVTWVQIKRKWNLLMDDKESRAIEKILNDCEAAGKQN